MLPILYQDDDIIAVDKPPGLASIPERRKTAPSVLAQLSGQSEHKIHVLHRLDKQTSGVIVFAKNTRAHKYLSQQFTSRTVKKTYLALVHGVIADGRGVIDKPLRQFGSGRVAVDTADGRPSVTEFEVAQRFDSYTLVRAYPLTGRLHQLRVHFYSIGHPIVGDWRYGQNRDAIYDVRLMLHAQQITFQLPAGEVLSLEAPIPESFKTVLDMLGRH